MPSTTKDTAISVRTTDEIKAAAAKAAAEDGRSVSSYVERLLVQHLRAAGHLPS